jgi:hypothetical protein
MNEPLPSSSVVLQTKLAQTLKICLGVGIPLATLNLITGMCSDLAMRRAWGESTDFSANSIGRDLKIGMSAAGLGIGFDVVLTALIAIIGHMYVDNWLYHQKGKTADEMMAKKKALGATLGCLNGLSTSLGLAFASTRMTGNPVTAEVSKIIVFSQILSGMITPPLVLGAVLLAYYFTRNSTCSPDSALAGLRNYASCLKAKVNSVNSTVPSTALGLPGTGTSRSLPGNSMA